MQHLKIIKGEEREIKLFGFGIWEYKELMNKRWNEFLDRHNFRKETQEMRLLAESILHLEDILIKNEKNHRGEIYLLKQEIRKLERELKKWTENRGRKPVLTTEQHEQIKQCRADGESCRKLAREYGVSERTIRRVIAFADTPEHTAKPYK
jgi:DNA invertase Pin-like site-specific DNA recombinase